MSNPKPIRIDEKTEQRLSELADMLGEQRFSKLVKKCIEIAHYVGKQKKIEDDFLARLYRDLVVDSNVVELNTVVDSNVVDHTTLYSSKKKEKKDVESSNLTESYQQPHLSDRVKDRMPYGEEFELTWIMWRQYIHAKTGSHLIPMTEFAQLKELSDLCDESKAIQTIKNSIKNGWTGIFPKREKQANSKSRTTFSADKAQAAFDKTFGSDSE